jgi:hypothetical protein
MNNSLESHKFFPYIAWTLVIGFAIFAYMLTVRFQQELAEIGDGVERLEQKINELDSAKPIVPAQ